MEIRFPPPKRLTRHDALSITRKAGFDRTIGFVIRPHFKDKMHERNFTMSDIKHLLANGEISTEPEFDERHENWKWHVSGTDIEGVPLQIVVAYDFSTNRFFFITGFGV